MEKFNPYSEKIRRTDPEIVSKLNELIDEINKINERLNEHEKAGGHVEFVHRDYAKQCVESMDWEDE